MTFLQSIHFWIEQTTRFVSPQMVAFEWIITAVLIVASIFGTERLEGPLGYLSLRFKRFADNKGLGIAVCGALPVLLRVMLLGGVPVPEPSIHDEFSHLLLSDTLAHGRLTNPTHPMWEHFESIHIIQRPTYASMYPPANGIFLAVGQVIFREPWAGVVLSVGLMYAAMCWMMQQWMQPQWALYGTVIAISRFGIFGPWINSYLGGPVSALGGALLIGSAPRLREGGARFVHSFLFGLGMVILMNSRPFEGALLTVGVVIYILPAYFRGVRVVWVPAATLLACGFLFTGFYSWRVTGDPVRLPYEVNRDTYGWPENLAFLPVHPVTLRHQVLRKMNALEVQRRDVFKKWDLLVDDLDRRVFENWAFFIGPLLTLPLLAAIANFRDRQTWPLLVFLGMIAVLNCFQLVLYPFHLGPVVPVMFVLVARGLRNIFLRLPARGLLAIGLPACLLLTGCIKQEADRLGIAVTYWERASEPHGVPRAAIQHWLSNRPRKQLVIVRYDPLHSPNQEWVYNGADIDTSKVVWAREMDSQSNICLLDYFKDREAWLLEADAWPQHVAHYRPDSESDLRICPSESR